MNTLLKFLDYFEIILWKNPRAAENDIFIYLMASWF